MRKPNYGFEKRQKELAKAQKREEKRLKRAARAEAGAEAGAEPESEEAQSPDFTPGEPAVE